MNQFFFISVQPLKFAVIAGYLFATVFGVGVHAHQTFSHQNGIDEHSHQFVMHAHDDLIGAHKTRVIVAENLDHDVPTVQLAGVYASRVDLKPAGESATVETLSIYRSDCVVAEIPPDASPPLLSRLNSHLTGRAPPAV